MNLKTLINKIADGTKLILSVPTMMFLDRENTPLEATHVVNKFEEGRADMIAMKYYGELSYVDLILKFNGISDPFSIKEGDILKIPVTNAPLSKFERPLTIDEDAVKQQFTDSNNLNQKDQKRIEALKKKYDKDNLLPTNVLPVGKQGFKFVRGNIVFGRQADSDPVVQKIESDINRGTSG